MSQQLPTHLVVHFTALTSLLGALSKPSQFRILLFLWRALKREENLQAYRPTSSTLFQLDLSACRSLFGFWDMLASFRRQNWEVAVSSGSSLQTMFRVGWLHLEQSLRTHLGQLVFTSVNQSQERLAILLDQFVQVGLTLRPLTPWSASILGIISASVSYWYFWHGVVNCCYLLHGQDKLVLLTLRIPKAIDPLALSICLFLLEHRLLCLMRLFKFESKPVVTVQSH